MRPKNKLSLLALVVAMAMVVPAFSVVYAFQENDTTTDVRIYFNGQDGEEDLGALRVKGMYDSFAIAKLTDREIGVLKSKGYVVIGEPGLHTIALNGYVFDTRSGEPEIAEELKITNDSAEQFDFQYSFLVELLPNCQIL